MSHTYVLSGLCRWHSKYCGISNIWIISCWKL